MAAASCCAAAGCGPLLTLLCFTHMRRGATPPSRRSLNPPVSLVLLSPHGSARGLAIAYPPLAYISLVAPTPPPSPSGRSGCARVLPGLAAAVGGHLSFETGPLLQDTLLAYGLRSVRLSCGPGRPRMALWRACIACPLRALNSLGPVAGRVPLPSGSLSPSLSCVVLQTYYPQVSLLDAVVVFRRTSISMWPGVNIRDVLRHLGDVAATSFWLVDGCV